jgi:hypothetical protein
MGEKSLITFSFLPILLSTFIIGEEETNRRREGAGVMLLLSLYHSRAYDAEVI